MTDETAQVAAEEPSATPTPPEPHPEDASQAIDAAFEQIDAQEAKEEPGPKEAEPEQEPADEDRPRNADGTFKAKEEEKAPEPPEEDSGIRDAPQRFSADAKAAWKDAPAPVRGEINRLMREMESGLQEHQARWEPLKELDALAKQHGTDIQTAMKQYIAFEQQIRRDPIAGLTQTCKELGLDFMQIVAEVSGQKPEGLPQTNSAMTALQGRFDVMEGQLKQVSTTIQTQREDTNLRDVKAFAAENPRFEELSGIISKLLSTGMTDELKEAYSMAERLNPAPASPPAAQTRAPDPPAQTRDASLSISGAPSSGKETEKRKAPPSAGEAVDNAFAQLSG